MLFVLEYQHYSQRWVILRSSARLPTERQLSAAVKKHTPDVVILDLEMPKMSGVEAAKIIKLKYPQTKILILSGFENEKYVTQILKSGAGGYVVKNVGKDELADAIRIVAEGKRFFSPSVSRIMVEGLLRKHSAELEKLSHIREPLTDLEMEILSFLTQGLKLKRSASGSQ